MSNPYLMTTDLIQQFCDHLKAEHKSHSTIIAYAKDLQQLREYTGQKLEDLSFNEISEAIKYMQESHKFTPKTISRKINSYRTFYKYLAAKGLVNSNPAEEVQHPKYTTKPQRFLSPMEYLALREVSRTNSRLYTMIELMLQTGLRIGEVSRLKRSDIVLTGAHPHIFVEEFSTTEARRIPLNSKSVQLLKAFLAANKDIKATAPLFTTREGKAIIIRNIRSSVDRAMLKAGIRNACVNDLRNTFIIAQLQAGVPVEIIADAVGHRSKTTTLKYVELLDEPYRPNGESKLADI